MQKLREIGQLLRDFGKTILWTILVGFGLMAVASLVWGFTGMLWVFFPLLAVIVLLARGEELIVRPAKLAWTAIVAVVAFAFFWTLTNELFTTVAEQALGGAASVLLALGLAFRYAGSTHKGWWHTLAITNCAAYLVVAGLAQWALPPTMRTTTADTHKGTVQSVVYWLNSQSRGAGKKIFRSGFSTEREAEVRPEVVVSVPGMATDFRDDTGVAITADPIKVGDTLVQFEEVQPFDGEDFVKVKVDRMPAVFGWFKYRTMLKNLSSPPPAVATATAPPSPAPAVAAAAPLPAAAPPAPPPAVDTEQVTVTDTAWIQSQVKVAASQRFWLGPFSDRAEAARVLVSVGQARQTPLDPDRLVKWGQWARVTREGGDSTLQNVYVRLTKGPPMTLKVTVNEP